VIWENGRMRELATPPGADGCSAGAINNHGDIAGSCFVAPESVPVVWQRGKTPILLPGPSGLVISATDINDSGVITLVGFNSPRTSIASGINAHGVVAGGGFTGNLGQVGDLPFLWADGTMHLLPIPPGRVGAQAVVINNRGVIAGVAILPTGDTYAVLWVPDRSRNGGGAP
jgi:uncharacterized membrane protein